VVSIKTEIGHKHQHHEAIALAGPRSSLEDQQQRWEDPEEVVAGGCATEKKERTEQLSPGKQAPGEMPDLRKCQEERRQA
jgi:hypothetical protein